MSFDIILPELFNQFHTFCKKIGCFSLSLTTNISCMKPVAAIITAEKIFYIRQINQPCFSSEFHFHEQCQLAYIIKGSGKRIVGDSVEHFEENELVFIGSNLPHVWYTEKDKRKRKTTQSVSLSLFISPQSFLN